MRIARSGVTLLGFVAAVALVTPGRLAAQKKERDLITRDEIVHTAAKQQDLYAAIRNLRPHFLSPPGRRSMNVDRGGVASTENPGGLPVSHAESPKIVIYIDGNRSGDPDVLKGILTENVEEVRYMSPGQASAEYGLGHDGGAILIKLWHGPKP